MGDFRSGCGSGAAGDALGGDQGLEVCLGDAESEGESGDGESGRQGFSVFPATNCVWTNPNRLGSSDLAPVALPSEHHCDEGLSHDMREVSRKLWRASAFSQFGETPCILAFMQFGEVLLAEIKARRLTQIGFASLVGSSSGNITDIIKGRRTPPLKHLDAWADALHLTGPKRDYFLALAQAEHVPDVLRDQFRRAATESYEASQINLVNGLQPWAPMTRSEAWQYLASGSPLAQLRERVVSCLIYWQQQGITADDAWAFLRPRLPPPHPSTAVDRNRFDDCWTDNTKLLGPTALLHLLEAIEAQPGSITGAMADMVWRDFMGTYCHPGSIEPANVDDPNVASLLADLETAQNNLVKATSETQAARDEAERLRQDVLALGRQLADRQREVEKLIRQMARLHSRATSDEGSLNTGLPTEEEFGRPPLRRMGRSLVVPKVPQEEGQKPTP